MTNQQTDYKKNEKYRSLFENFAGRVHGTDHQFLFAPPCLREEGDGVLVVIQKKGQQIHSSVFGMFSYRHTMYIPQHVVLFSDLTCLSRN